MAKLSFSSWFAHYPARLLGGLGLSLACWGWGELGSIAAAHVVKIQDSGDILLTYDPPAIAEHQAIYESLASNGFFDALVDELNTDLAFPQDIQITFTECGEVNAFYYPDYVEVTMCYELLEQFIYIFGVEDGTDGFDDAVIDASLFTFFHELGHALVHQYELPITGREEDAVDDFAAVMLIDIYGDEAGLLSGMWQFESEAIEEQENLADLPYWGEHSLSTQRFYNTACLIYGSEPNTYEFLIEEGALPEDRAERCPAEYEQKSRAWFTLLERFWQGE
ncbi:MAG: DUF4344 domain-containing metallopeptidase [Spirulina sp. SIO3F2]|nr:DUF4344 domain-containing metallopeptidase [Spirulina sp. SIO3F2]